MIPMKLTPLSALATVSAGQSAPKDNEFSESGTPFVRAGSLDTLLSGKSESDLELVSDETAKRRKLKLYPKGTVLFAKSGMSATKDRIYVLQNPAYVVSHLAVLIPKDSTLANYLRLVLKAFPPSSLIKDPAYPAISLREIEDFKIPFPEQFDDQKRIALLLGKVEALIAQRKQHLQQLDELLRSVFLGMFGDPIRNEKGWKIEPLGELATIERGRFSPRPRNDPKFYNGQYPFIQTGDISRSNGRLREYTQTLNELGIKVSKEFGVGTIVIAIVGATIGETAILDIPTYAPDSVIGITPKTGVKKTEAVFMEFLLRFWKPVLRARAPEAARANINIETLRPLPIIWPKEDDRTKFAAIVDKVESLKSGYQQSLTDLENLYGALSQQAFKGELDLSRVPLPPDSLSEYENEQDEAVAPIKSDIPKGIKIKLESLNALNEKASGFNDIARAARASSLIDSKQFDIVKQAAAQLAACHSPIEQLKNMSGIASAMEQLESTIKPLNLSQYDSIAKTAELARSMASSISKSDLSWLDQQRNAALKYANAPFESMRSAMEKIESLNYRQADSIAKNIGLANNLRVSDLHDDTLRNSASVSSSIAGLESLQREQLESARRAQSALDYSTIVPKFDTSISRAYLDAQKATFDPLADIRSAMGSATSAYDQYLASNSLASYLASVEDYDRPSFYAEDILDILSRSAEALSFESLKEQLNELATIDSLGYETIKAILFDLLAENQIKQSFDPEQQILVFSIAENGSEQ